MGDPIGHRKVLVWSAVAAGLFYLPQAAVGEVWQLIVLQGLFGLASGGLVAAPSALLAHFTPPGAEGAVFGLDNSVTSFGRTLSPLIGSGIAMLVGLRGPFAAAGLTYLAMGLVAFLLLPRRATLPAAQASPDEESILAASPETDALPPPAGR
jgi:DHA1 family multidrug resistance protein-like MFS transporter